MKDDTLASRIIEACRQNPHMSNREIGKLLGCGKTTVHKHRIRVEGAPAVRSAPPDDTPQDIDALALRTALKRQALNLDEIAARFGVTKGQALDATEALKGQGVNIAQFGDRYAIHHEPVPLDAGNELFRLESDYEGRYKIGALGDTHLGSKYCRLDILNALYDWYADQGVTSVYHTGNYIDGEARFNKFDLIPRCHGLQNQLDYFAELYPQRKGITTYFIAGDDHEGWYAQREGVDIGRMTQDTAERGGRFDLKYLGYIEAFINLTHKQTQASAQMLVMHPGGGSAYAHSYAPQKIVEGFQGGEKPAVLLIGHYHKLSYDIIRNVHTVQTGCTKDLDTFGRKKKLSYHVGGTLLEMWQDDRGSIMEFTPRFRQFFDRGYHNNSFSLAGANYNMAKGRA